VTNHLCYGTATTVKVTTNLFSRIYHKQTDIQLTERNDKASGGEEDDSGKAFFENKIIDLFFL
jgi:hypothetical protein